MYAREVQGQPEPLTFGVSGKLIMNVLVMYDRQTETYWSQILGQAVEGELAGAKLTPIAAMQTSWEKWRDLHPDTVALKKGFNSSRDPYIDYYSRSSAGVIGESIVDNRLSTKALGIGLVIDNQPAFYPVTLLRRDRFVNDSLAGQPLLVTYYPEALTGLVFSREVDGQVLTFAVEDPEVELPTLVDAETGSRWSSFDGVAIDGRLAGKSLDRIPSTTSFWFGWTDWHPDTYLYGEDRLPKQPQ